MVWAVVTGKVLRVVSGDKIIVSVEKRRLLIHLVGIETPAPGQLFGLDAQQHLERLVGNEEIQIGIRPNDWIPKHPRPKEITGVVWRHLTDNEEVNLSLLRAGLAGYRRPAPYAMSGYGQCRYQKAEEEARTAKRGLWSAHSTFSISASGRYQGGLMNL